MKFRIYPAIDIMDGKVVRLYKGKKDEVKVYGDPLKVAEKFSEYVDKIHIVDLDGAFSGKPQNLDIVEKIIRDVGVRVQIGGGFRDYESIKKAYDIGVENVIIGTKALDISFLERITSEFEGITVSLDSKGGKIFTKGWIEEESLLVEDAYKMLRKFVNRFVYTVIDRDGTLLGIEKIKRFWGDEEFIYAGGVATPTDIIQLAEIGFSGVIIGKALYEGTISLEEALEVAKSVGKKNYSSS